MHDMLHTMSIDDCDDANDVLNAWDVAQERARARAEKAARVRP